jgi:hypothetical protein
MLQPLKWRKYLKLVEFGLVTLDELNRQVCRFASGQVPCLISAVERMFAESATKQQQIFVVIKLVPRGVGFKLPNLRLQSVADAARIPAFLHLHRGFGFSEIWCCATRNDAGLLSVAGRIVYLQDRYQFGQLVEQVWRCSPRLLEDYSPELPFSYVRAFRPSWGYSYKVEELRCSAGDGSDEILGQFFSSMRTIERSREKLECFIADLEGYGFRVFNLEYKILGNRFVVIDWDTPDDLAVIAN